MKYNLSRIMLRAWRIYRKGGRTFSEALKAAWYMAKVNAARIRAAGAGISEETRSWYAWKAAGREVVHGSKALFKVQVLDDTTKTGTRIKSYFGISQTYML